MKVLLYYIHLHSIYLLSTSSVSSESKHPLLVTPVTFVSCGPNSVRIGVEMDVASAGASEQGRRSPSVSVGLCWSFPSFPSGSPTSSCLPDSVGLGCGLTNFASKDSLNYVFLEAKLMLYFLSACWLAVFFCALHFSQFPYIDVE